MKKTLALLLLSASMSFAQDAPKPVELTTAQLKVELARKDVEIAQMKLQLIQLQAQLAYQNAQTELAGAQKALQEETEPKPTK